TVPPYHPVWASAGSPGSRPWSFPTCLGSLTPLSRHGRHTEVVISELHTWLVCTPVNASPASLRTQAHDSEPKWCATPFLCGSLIRYSLPVYPGAFLDHLVGTKQHRLRDCCSNLLRSLQVNSQFKLCRLFHGKFGRVCAF